MMLAIYIYTLASLLDSRLHPRGFMYNINTDQWVEEEAICKQVISGVFCTTDFDLPNRDMEYETLLLHKCIIFLSFMSLTLANIPFFFSDWLVGLGPWNGLCKSMHITEDVKNVMLSLESIPFTERAHYFKQVFLILNIYLSYF